MFDQKTEINSKTIKIIRKWTYCVTLVPYCNKLYCNMIQKQYFVPDFAFLYRVVVPIPTQRGFYPKPKLPFFNFQLQMITNITGKRKEKKFQ